MIERPKILIVDDKKENLFALRQVLRDVDAEVIAATSGDQALAATLDNDFAVAILDVQMPGMTGYELAELLRGDQKTEAIPIVFMTADYVDEQHMFKGYEAGGIDYITKPYAPKILLSKLKVLLEMDRTRRELTLHRDHLETLVAVRTAELKERVKELKCLYAIASLVAKPGTSIDAALLAVVELIPSGWQYPQITGARITFEGREFASANFRETAWRHAAAMAIGGDPVGTVEVCYLEERPTLDQGPFLREEVELLTIIARQLETMIDRKRAEEALLMNEERTRLILDGLDALVYVADLQSYEMLFMNKFGRDIWGEYRGRKCWQVLQAGQDGPCPFCTNDRLLSADGVPTGVHAWEIKNSHDQQWYDCRDQAIRWHEGRLVRMEIATNISLRKQAEQEIITAKEEWERTFEAIGDIAMIIRPDLRIARVNKQAALTFATTTDKLVGRLCYEVFRGESQPCAGCPIVDAFHDSHVHTAEIEHKALGKIFQVSASPVVSGDGRVVSIIHFAKDITAHMELEHRLSQAQKLEAIGTLAGGIAHDFNNILTPILGYAEMAQADLDPGHPAVNQLQEVVKAGLRAKDLVQQILTFSRQREHELMPLSPHILVKEALKLLRASIPTSIEIRQNIDANSGMVLADETQLHQILMNLCTNAYHAMRESGGVLTVSLHPAQIVRGDPKVNGLALTPGAYVVLEVSDTGYGIDPQTITKIFDPYFTTKKQGEGTGLGLSVVHGIVKKYCGHISVYSELGKGSTFRVYLPKIVSPQEAGEQPAVLQPLPGGRERVLVVDDDPTIMKLDTLILEDLGYRVTGLTGSKEALQVFQEAPHEFDLVLTDMTMPDMNGADLSLRIHTIRPDIPIILCSGFSTLIDGDKAREIGIRKFLLKPVLRKNLAETVRDALDGVTGGEGSP